MSDGIIRDFDYEAKKLALEIKENEAKYISGELPLDEPLKKTDELYTLAVAEAEKTGASKVIQDSSLMQMHSKIIRQSAKSYKPDTLIFEPRAFSVKLKTFYSPVSVNGEDKRATNKVYSLIWKKLGEEACKNMHVTPTFNFLYGTFQVDPVTPVKKKRKRIEKEKVAEAVKPQTMKLSESSEGKDLSLSRATRAISILFKLLKKTNTSSLCFYEFVINPTSFTNTIENIFTVSLLVQNGYACIFPDEQGLPCIRPVEKDEKNDRQASSMKRIQSIISMSSEEWRAIVDKFKFTQCLLPPPRSKQS